MKRFFTIIESLIGIAIIYILMVMNNASGTVKQ